MGRPHITSDRIRNFNAAIFGAGKYVVDTGSKFSYEIISNNQIKINDGQLISQGTHACIDLNNYEELQIDTGLQGLKRNDLIVARYTRNKITDVESMQMVVIKGTSSEDAVDPPYITGDVLSGASEDDMPLYRVRLDGLNIEKVECMFTVIPSLPSVNAKAEQNAEDIEAIRRTSDNKMTGNCKVLLGNAASGLKTLTDKISNYKYLLMYVGDHDVTFESFIIPTSIVPSYISDTNMIAFGIDTTRLGQRCYGIATYKSDTQLYLQVSEGLSMSIYGIN